MTSIGNLTDTLALYRSKVRGRVSANKSLIYEMKNDSTFNINFGPNSSVVKGIQEALQKKKNSFVESTPLSRCGTLGFYSASIKYRHNVFLRRNSVRIIQK